MVVQAGPLPTADRKLARRTSSLKETFKGMKVHLAELSSKVKDKTVKARRSPTAGQRKSTVGTTNTTLERGNSWKAAAVAIKGGLTLKNKGESLFFARLSQESDCASDGMPYCLALFAWSTISA